MDLFSIRGWLFLILIALVVIGFFLFFIHKDIKDTKAHTARLLADNAHLGNLIKAFTTGVTNVPHP